MTAKSSKEIVDVIARIFQAIGSPSREARLVAEELVDADLLGVQSHGIMRVPEYVEAQKRGDLRPGAPSTIIRETDCAALLDGGRNFGQVAAYRALEIAVKKAGAGGVGCVVVRNCHHVGRLGAYPEAAARQDLVCIATATVRPRGHFVAPWGGREGRLGTNPIAYGVPTGGLPLLTDFATSVIPEGEVRLALNSKRLLPELAAIDASGQPTRDPAAFYGPPRGALLPFGGSVAYKGYALALLAEILGGSLGGSEVSDEARSSNCVWLLVLDPAAFLSIAEFKRLTGDVVAYMKSSPPLTEEGEVLVPGEREFRHRGASDGQVPLAPETWELLLATASDLGVQVDASGDSSVEATVGDG